MSPVVRRSASAAAVILALALAGCASGASRPAPSATQFPPGLTAKLVEPGAEAEGPEVRIELQNSSEYPLEIRALRIDDDRFDGVAVRVIGQRDRVSPGRTALVRMRMPEMDCTARAASTPVITLTYSLGPSASVAVRALDDPSDVLGAMFAQQCEVVAP